MRFPRRLSPMLSPMRRLATLAVVWAAASGSAWSQAGEAAGAFGETVDVELVNVEVWVTDRAGDPVTGLTVDDFEVREDGQPVPVSYFDEVRGVPELTERPRPLAAEEPEAEARREDPGASPESETGPAPGYLVLYFDELFLGPTGREDLVRDLRSFLESQLVAPERVLILKQDEYLTVEAPLGSSRAVLEAALEQFAKPSPRGLQLRADERNTIRELQAEWERLSVLGGTAPGQDPCDFFAADAFRQVQHHSRLARERVAETLTHLSSTSSFLAGLPGMKTLVYVSDGLTMTPGASFMSYVKAVCPGRQDDRRLDLQDGMSGSFRALSRHANANRVTMYTVQALGLRRSSNLSTSDQRGVRNTYRGLQRYETETRTSERQGLTFLAAETGGRAIVNRNTLVGELEEIARDMSGYYSLAYAPPHGGDGREHRIDVKVRGGRKLEVRHRPGYQDKGPDQRMAERLESTLYLNLASNPLGVRLGAAAVEPGKKNKLAVPFHVMVPVEKITFLPRQGGEVARLKVQAMAQNERNRKTGFQQKVFEVGRPASMEADQLVDLALTLELGQGIHVVAFAVRDEASQETSFVSTGLDLRPQDGASSGGASE